MQKKLFYKILMIFVFDGIPIEFISIETGIDICDSDIQPLKAFFSIEFTEEGIEICFNDEQS